MGHVVLLSQVHQQGAGLEVEQQTIKLLSVLDASITGNCFDLLVHFESHNQFIAITQHVTECDAWAELWGSIIIGVAANTVSETPTLIGRLTGSALACECHLLPDGGRSEKHPPPSSKYTVSLLVNRQPPRVQTGISQNASKPSEEEGTQFDSHKKAHRSERSWEDFNNPLKSIYKQMRQKLSKEATDLMQTIE